MHQQLLSSYAAASPAKRTRTAGQQQSEGLASSLASGGLHTSLRCALQAAIDEAEDPTRTSEPPIINSLLSLSVPRPRGNPLATGGRRPWGARPRRRGIAGHRKAVA